MGNSAEFYMNHEQSNDVLSHRVILKEFGAEEQLADDMLNDQGKKNILPPVKTSALCGFYSIKFIIFE